MLKITVEQQSKEKSSEVGQQNRYVSETWVDAS